MKLYMLATYTVTDVWAASTNLEPRAARRWCEDALREVMELVVNSLPVRADEPPPSVVIDAIDSPDHAHSVFILRSGWPLPATRGDLSILPVPAAAAGGLVTPPCPKCGKHTVDGECFFCAKSARGLLARWFDVSTWGTFDYVSALAIVFFAGLSAGLLVAHLGK